MKSNRFSPQENVANFTVKSQAKIRLWPCVLFVQEERLHPLLGELLNNSYPLYIDTSPTANYGR